MRKGTPPKKPLTPFFLFRNRMKEKEIVMGGKEAGEKWRSLSDHERKPYVDEYRKAKEKFDKYLEEVEGISAKSPRRKTEKPNCFKSARIRAICGQKKEVLQMNQNVYKGIGKVLVFL